MLTPQSPLKRTAAILTSKVIRTGWVSAILALLAIPVPAQQWVAYNDHVAGIVGSTTALNATTNDMRRVGGPYTLKDISTGNVIPGVTMTVSQTGNGIPQNGYSAGNPDVGTPLHYTFDGYCYFGANVIQLTNGQTVTVTFSGLNPSCRYKFQAGSVRGDISCSDRWTKCDITGVDSVTPNHQQGSTSPYGIITSANEPTLMTGTEVAFNSGINLAGDMVEWDGINPGSDGSFSVTSTKWYYTTPVPSHGMQSGMFTPNSSKSAYALDAFRLEECSDCGDTPFTAYLSPANVNELECKPLILSVSTIFGIPPFTYYWFKDGAPLNDATNSSLIIQRARPADSGAYQVLVFDSTPEEQQSWLTDFSYVTVNPDTNPPALLFATGGPDLYTLTATFSKPVSFSGVSAFTVFTTNGISALPIVSATVTNQTNVILVTTTPRDSRFYKVVVNSGVVACNDLEAAPGSFVLLQEMPMTLLSFTGQPWQYNESGTDVGGEWLANGYDDHGPGWLSGIGPFVADRGTVTTVAGYPATQITLTNPATLVDFSSYYFRTHVAWPPNADPAMSTVSMRTIIDDGCIVYVNGTEAYRTTNVVTGVNDSYAQYLGFTGVTPAVSTNIPINPALFWAGDNVIAVYLKQAGANSSDAAMGLEITANITNVPPPPPPLQVTPSNAILTECGTLHLAATIYGGWPPYNCQWFLGTNPLTNNERISGATSAQLTVANLQPADAGNYHLRIIDSAPTPSTAETADVPVTVTPVPVPKMLLAACQPNNSTITLNFDASVNIAHADGSDFIIHAVNGGSDILVTNVTPLTGTSFTLQAASPLLEGYYDLRIQGTGVSTCAGNLPSGTSIRIDTPVLVFGVDGTTWKYNQSGQDLGTAWLANNYNDQDPTQGWTNGSALFDGKVNDGVLSYRTETTNFTVRSFLNLKTPEYLSGSTNIPTYYFKKHITFPYSLVRGFWIRPAWDDGGALYINGQLAYADRFNAPFSSYATAGAAAGDVAYTGPFFVPATNVIDGENVLAVELKQNSYNSYDVSMGLELWVVGDPIEPKRFRITDNGTTISLSWVPVGGTLWYSSDLTNWTQGSTADPQTFNKADAQYRFFQIREP